MKILTFFLFFLFYPFFSQSQTVDQIINDFYKASGGLENWKTISSIQFTAENEAFLPYSDKISSFNIMYEKKPNLFLMDKKSNEDGSSKKIMFDGKAVWDIKPNEKPSKNVVMDNAMKMLKDKRMGLFLFGFRLLDYDSNGYSAIKLTDEETNKHFVVKLFQSDYSFKIFFNKQNKLIDFYETDITVIKLSNYQKTGNILIPLITETFKEDELISKEKINEFKVNPALEEKWFSVEYYEN